MKNNLITALTLGVLLCLPACCCKKQCRKDTPAPEVATTVTEVAIKDSIDAFDANVIILDDESLLIADNQEAAPKTSIKF